MADERPGNSNNEKLSPLERYLAKQKQLKTDEPPKPKRVVPQPAKTPEIPSDESSRYGVPTAPAFPRPKSEPAKFGLGSRRVAQPSGENASTAQSAVSAESRNAGGAASITTASSSTADNTTFDNSNAERASALSSSAHTATHDEGVYAAAARENSPSQTFAIPGAPASFFVRLLAYILDMLIISAITVPVRKLLGLVFNLMTFGNADLVAGPVAFIAFYGTLFAYFGYFYSEKGASPGKMLFKIQIHEADAPFARLGYGKAFFRESIGKIAAAAPLFIGYLVSLFRADRRALHDLLFDTQVTRAKNSPQSEP